HGNASIHGRADAVIRGRDPCGELDVQPMIREVGRRADLFDLFSLDARSTGRRLRATLWDQALALLPRFGWNDGGCVLLALAPSRLLAGHAHRRVAVIAPERGPWVQHALIEVRLAGLPWYIDAGGAAMRHEVTSRHRVREGFQAPVIVGLADAPMHPDTPT